MFDMFEYVPVLDTPTYPVKDIVSWLPPTQRSRLLEKPDFGTPWPRLLGLAGCWPRDGVHLWELGPFSHPWVSMVRKPAGCWWLGASAGEFFTNGPRMALCSTDVLLRKPGIFEDEQVAKLRTIPLFVRTTAAPSVCPGW